MDVVAKFNEHLAHIHDRVEYAIVNIAATNATEKALILSRARERITLLRLLVVRMPEEMESELSRIKYSSHADLNSMIDALEGSIIDLENGLSTCGDFQTIPIELGYEGANQYPLLPEDE